MHLFLMIMSPRQGFGDNMHFNWISTNKWQLSICAVHQWWRHISIAHVLEECSLIILVCSIDIDFVIGSLAFLSAVSLIPPLHWFYWCSNSCLLPPLPHRFSWHGQVRRICWPTRMPIMQVLGYLRHPNSLLQFSCYFKMHYKHLMS